MHIEYSVSKKEQSVGLVGACGAGRTRCGSGWRRGVVATRWPVYKITVMIVVMAAGFLFEFELKVEVFECREKASPCPCFLLLLPPSSSVRATPTERELSQREES